jgi:uncharacterized UBP type Zn finger protein
MNNIRSALLSTMIKYVEDLKEIRIATQHDKVYKDECAYSFDTSESETGLFVCLNTFVAVSKKYLTVHFNKTNSHFYLHIKTYRKKVNLLSSYINFFNIFNEFCL